MSQFWETVSGIILSIGGAGAIIVGVVKFATNQIAKQITLLYKNELDKEIERLKADLVNRNHSYQAKFDKEFHLYGKLMASFLRMKKTVFWLFPIFDHPPSDNLFPICGPHLENKGSEISKLMSECYRRSSEIQEKFDVMTKILRKHIAQRLE